MKNKVADGYSNISLLSIDDIRVKSKYKNSIVINGKSIPGMIVLISIDPEVTEEILSTKFDEYYKQNNYTSSCVLDTSNKIFKLILSVDGISPGYIDTKLSNSHVQGYAQIALIE